MKLPYCTRWGFNTKTNLQCSWLREAGRVLGAGTSWDQNKHGMKSKEKIVSDGYKHLETSSFFSMFTLFDAKGNSGLQAERHHPAIPRWVCSSFSSWNPLDFFVLEEKYISKTEKKKEGGWWWWWRKKFTSWWIVTHDPDDTTQPGRSSTGSLCIHILSAASLYTSSSLSIYLNPPAHALRLRSRNGEIRGGSSISRKQRERAAGRSLAARRTVSRKPGTAVLWAI